MEIEEEKKKNVSSEDEETKSQENQLLNSELAADNEGEDENRFSDEGMETEIEVTQDSINGDIKKTKKKKKKSDSCLEEQEKSKPIPDNESENEKNSKDASNDLINPAYTSHSDEVQTTKPETKKEQYKTKLKRLQTDPFYPLYIILICKVCVILPIAIYSCDVILGVNVLEDPELGLDLVKKQTNFFNESNAPLLTVIDHPYNHGIPNTVLRVVQRLSKERTKRQAPAEGSEPTALDEVPATSTSVSLNQTLPTLLNGVMNDTLRSNKTDIRTTASTTLNRTNSASITTESETLITDTNTLEPNTTKNGTRNETDSFCETELYFIQQHQNLRNMTKSNHEKEYDWYVDMNNTLFKYQQALFFMFTVIGFILLLSSMGTRVDAILNEKWSSSLLIIFLFYAISMSLTAKVFALQSGANGVRCFLCRMVSFCDDINPWDLRPNVYFPTELNWNTVAFVSFILKIFDCFIIGIVTLKYVLDPDKDACWMIVLKIAGWILVFPMMVITPVAGVFRYSVLPVTVPENVAAQLAFEVIFYIGVVFWAIALIILPFFCKIRMCNKEENYEDEEDYY